MNASIDAERVLDAFLAPEHDRLADRVLDAALADIARTPQQRAMRVPWRFRNMTPILRVAILAAVLAAVIGGGALLLAGVGPAPSPTPDTSSSPSLAPTTGETTPGIDGWTPFTSDVYGLTFSVPDDWQREVSATRAWQRTDGFPIDRAGFSEAFASPGEGDAQVGLWVWQYVPDPSASLDSREALRFIARSIVCAVDTAVCDTFPTVARDLCLGVVACQPAMLVPLSDGQMAFIPDMERGTVTIVEIGRADGHPSTDRYGGASRLLTSILTTFDVHTPAPGQIQAETQVAPGIKDWKVYTSATS